MKAREGFVTNSSSSSFVVVMKNDVTHDEIEEKISALFALDKDHPLYRFSNEIKNYLLLCIFNADHYTKLTAKDFIYEYCDDEDDDDLALLMQYGNLIFGFFHDDEGAEQWLCLNDLNYEDDDIIIKHYGGY